MPPVKCLLPVKAASTTSPSGSGRITPSKENSPCAGSSIVSRYGTGSAALQPSMRQCIVFDGRCSVAPSIARQPPSSSRSSSRPSLAKASPSGGSCAVSLSTPRETVYCAVQNGPNMRSGCALTVSPRAARSSNQKPFELPSGPRFETTATLPSMRAGGTSASTARDSSRPSAASRATSVTW